MFARFEASVMLPVSAAAMKYASCLNVNFIRVDFSRVSGYAEAWGLLRIDGPAHIIIDLRGVDLPHGGKRSDRLLRAPVDAQIDDRPADFAHDEEACGVDRSGFSAPPRARTQRLQQSYAKGTARGLEREHHCRGNIFSRQEISRCRAMFTHGRSRESQGMSARMNHARSLRANDQHLPEGAKFGGTQRFAKRRGCGLPLCECIENARAEGGIGDILRCHRACTGARMSAACRNRGR